MIETRVQVEAALKSLARLPMKQSAEALFAALGYSSRKTVELDGSPSSFLEFVDQEGALSKRSAAQTDKWRRVEFLFQLTNDEIPTLAEGNRTLLQGPQDYRNSIIESFVFIAIELEGADWTRGSLAGVTRELNRIFPMPAIVLFKHGGLVSLAVIDRRQNKKDSSRDVVERRISIVKDINPLTPHRAHVGILCDIAFSDVRVRGRGTPSNFRDLYDGWIEALSAQTLNTKFYKELANWFFWSVKQVTFPAAVTELDQNRQDEQNQIAVIRLLTRLIFVWFIKEKGIVAEAFFDPHELKKLLNEDVADNRESSTYYKAILQNLFFATLNTDKTSDRTWRTKASGGGLDGQYLVHTAFRFHDAFLDPDTALKLFQDVPFLNGGLFECLDREVSTRDIERNPDLKHRLVKEGSREVIRIDGFSERKDNPLTVPNKIFFAKAEKVDLNEEYDTKGKSYQADGLIELFARYKFTVEENTPVEEEVALDPELLGKVFENLLASYNADTRTTARKKSGSFYTPREVVDYMVVEALVAYFEGHVANRSSDVERRKPVSQMLDMAMPGEFDLTGTSQSKSDRADRGSELGERLRNLLSFTESGNPFTSDETDVLIGAIDNLKALDPACGSGAFPMGLLQKLIHVLHRLDPDNARWKAQNRRPIEDRLAAARRAPDPSRREVEIEEAEAALAKLDRDFSDANRPDYARKLYLIDKCLFGVDIQPIAVQIAKLRFFISLVVSQKIDRNEPNLNITALPNLETRLVAANSLIPIERPAQGDLFRNVKIAEKEAELRAVNARYFSARTVKTKRARREDIAGLRDELGELLKSDRGVPEEDARKMAAWDPFDQNSAAPFFDPEWMYALPTKFDLVIGNPPYVRQEAIKDQKPLLQKHYGDKDRQGNPLGCYSGTADLLIYFIQRGIELLNPGGAFAYITSNKWYRAKYGTNLRSWLNRNAELRCIIDFGDAEVFDAVAYPTIIIATRRDAPVQVPSKHEIMRVMNWPSELGKGDIPRFASLIDEIGFDMPQKSLSVDSWQLEPQSKRELLERIKAAGTPLGVLVEDRFFRGVTTGLNDAFVIDRATRDVLINEDKRSADLIKPYLRGRDLKRWEVDAQDQWLIFTRRGVDIETYPCIKRYLETYRTGLEPRPDTWRDEIDGKWEGRKAGPYKWFEIQDNIAYWKDFERPKIAYPDIALSPQFAYISEPMYLANTGYMIPDARMAIMAVLNSPVCEFFFKQISPQIQNGYYRFISQYVSQIPIPKMNIAEDRLCECVARTLNEGAQNSRLEQLLNGFVYELFFKEDLHQRKFTLFDEAEKAGLGLLVDLEGAELIQAAKEFADRVFVPTHPLYAMLFDLQALDVVRIIEGRE